MIKIELTEDTINKLVKGIEEIVLKAKKEDDKLYNLTDLCRELNLKYNTMKVKNLPFTRLGDKKKGKKYYSLPKVKRFLNIN